MSTVATPPVNFSSLAAELKTMIASSMSPCDLARFSQTSRQSRAISNRPNLYVDALLRLGFPSHIPTPAASLPQLCLVIFGGGKCKVCGKHTDALPFSYTARIRTCPGPCRNALINLKIIARITPPNQPNGKYDLLDYVEPWLPPLETPIGHRTFYLRSDLVRATTRLSEAIRLDKLQRVVGEPFKERKVILLKEWDRRALILAGSMKTALDVLNWQRGEYVWKRESLEKNITEHLLRILKIRGLELDPVELLRSPTLRQTIRSWHRDLEQISLHAFSVIQPLVMREIVLVKAGLPPPSFQCRKNDQFLCPVCDTNKSFSPDSIILHIHHKHPAEFPYIRHKYNDNPNTNYCELCPLSMKKFEFDGMRKHIAAKHKN
ncbi:hypothetical protein FB451DRAFT_1287971 [Mycena latifolia]|nr:hypothetical protein FB451DRAFT_1287971 [Mycena latifolia]